MKLRKSTARLRDRLDERGALAAVVFARREELGLRQDELADLAGCSVSFVRQLEQGKPTVQMATTLEVLGVLGLHLQIGSGQPGSVTISALLRDQLDGGDRG